MEVLTKTELRLRKTEIIRKIRDGIVFIHPTDTIYGLGCNALNSKAVRKIRDLKERPNSPLSVWAPSLQWIKDFCAINKEGEEWTKKLPGPFTLILPQKSKFAVAENVNPNTNSIGVRIPNHWYSDIVREVGVPIVTTSANKAGEPFMTSLENLNPEIEKGVEFMIYEGEKEGKPSKIINLVDGRFKER